MLAQDMPAWTLVGEYTGIWVMQDRMTQRVIEDPMGLGVMKYDRVVELAYTSQEGREDAQKGTPQQTLGLKTAVLSAQ